MTVNIFNRVGVAILTSRHEEQCSNRNTNTMRTYIGGENFRAVNINRNIDAYTIEAREYPHEGHCKSSSNLVGIFRSTVLSSQRGEDKNTDNTTDLHIN